MRDTVILKNVLYSVADSERDTVSVLLNVMKEKELVGSEQLMEGLNLVLDRMKGLEANVSSDA